jgi:hypothetical protein
MLFGWGAIAVGICHWQKFAIGIGVDRLECKGPQAVMLVDRFEG